MTIDDKYSRAAFENASDGEALSRELESLLTARMRAASRHAAEARAILADLEHIGHRLRSWDESTDFCTWGDDYGARPSPLRFVITLSWPDADDDDPREPGAEVAFGPWPEPPEPLVCPKCAMPMVSDIGRLDIKGHGSVDFELLPYCLMLGALRHEGKIGNVSVGLQLNVLRCPQCNGVWIEGTTRLGGALTMAAPPDIFASLFPPQGTWGGLERFLDEMLGHVDGWGPSRRATDGIDYQKTIEHSATRVRVCGRVWEVSHQTQHVFWLDVECEAPGANEVSWRLYFDLANASPRVSRNAVDVLMTPEGVEWRAIVSGSALLREDGLQVISVDS